MSDLVSEKELCERLRLNRKTCYFWRLQGMPFVEVGRVKIGYHIEDVQSWMKSNLKKSAMKGSN